MKTTLYTITYGILFELLTIEAYSRSGIAPATLIMIISSVYYSLIIGNFLVRLYSVIISKTQFFLVIVFNLALNPLVLYFSCLFFTSILLESDFLVFYGPIGNTLLILFDTLSLQKFKTVYHKNQLDIKFSEHCQRCGKGLDPLTAYCPSCHTISHKLSDTFFAFPDKHHLDFTEDIRRESKFCPHCGTKKADHKALNIALVPPIHICSKCHYFYIDNSCIEWGFASFPRKCLIVSLYLLAPFLLLTPLRNALADISSLRLHFTLLGIALLSLMLVMQTLYKDIQVSYQRLKANPNYDRILKYMGYQHLDTSFGQDKNKDI